jgi:hypothetical protein
MSEMAKSPHRPGYWEGQAVRLNMGEAWVFIPPPRPYSPGGWVPLDMLSALYSTSVLTEAEFERLFPECLPLQLPEEAFLVGGV